VACPPANLLSSPASRITTIITWRQICTQSMNTGNLACCTGSKCKTPLELNASHAIVSSWLPRLWPPTAAPAVGGSGAARNTRDPRWWSSCSSGPALTGLLSGAPHGLASPQTHLQRGKLMFELTWGKGGLEAYRASWQVVLQDALQKLLN